MCTREKCCRSKQIFPRIGYRWVAQQTFLALFAVLDSRHNYLMINFIIREKLILRLFVFCSSLDIPTWLTDFFCFHCLFSSTYLNEKSWKQKSVEKKCEGRNSSDTFWWWNSIFINRLSDTSICLLIAAVWDEWQKILGMKFDFSLLNKLYLSNKKLQLINISSNF